MLDSTVATLPDIVERLRDEADALHEHLSFGNGTGRKAHVAVCVMDEAADEIERLRRIVDKLIDAWPNDDIPVEGLDGRE